MIYHLTREGKYYWQNTHGFYKFADLVVWHDNPYAVETPDILKLTIDMTMVGGKVVHEV